MITAHGEYNLPIFKTSSHVSKRREYRIFEMTAPPRFFPLNHPSYLRRPDARENVLGGDVDASYRTRTVYFYHSSSDTH